MNHTHVYQNPLIERYAGKEMAYLFSDDMRFSTWRKLWLALAEAEQELGVDISDEQLDDLKKNIHNIDFEKAKAYEKKFRHDVMAHVHTYGDVAPKAKGIIHLGATSAFVVDNTDIIQMHAALTLVKKGLINIIDQLHTFILSYKKLPTLSYTHYQPAQLTTVGKRATLWAHSFILDVENIDFLLQKLKLRGVKGTTGTGASFKDLLDADYQKFKSLEKRVAEKMGFSSAYAVTGQTYDRKVDADILHTLGGVAQSAHKITNDIRLLAGQKQIEEPFEQTQIGSSAMAYKRNPMRSERVASLSKFVLSISQSCDMVAATQWLERSLDDSANKRLAIPQAFLAVDAILILLHNITSGLVVYPKIIEKYVQAELPFMVTEYILMKSVEKGGDRQQLHERIRVHSMEAGKQVKIEGKENDLLERLGSDDLIPFSLEELKKLCNPSDFTGFAEQQCQDFSEQHIVPLIQANSSLLGMNYEITV